MSSQRPRILLVEDERDVSDALQRDLGKEGFEVLAASSGRQGLELALEQRPDLVVLDESLPDLGGLEVCQELRRRGFEQPIVVLTARSETYDRVLGLELGADDYVCKPYSRRELVARIRVRLRRAPAAARPTFRHRFGDVELDFDRYVATRAGQSLELTPKEFDLLRFLVRCRGEVVTRARLLDEVWGYDAYPTTRTVDTHILALRKKIEADPSRPRFLLSVYGVGYKFVG